MTLLTVKVSQRLLLGDCVYSNINFNPTIVFFIYFITLSTLKLEVITSVSTNIFFLIQLLILVYFFCILSYSILVKLNSQLNFFLLFTVLSLLLFIAFLIVVKDFLLLLFFLEVVAVYYYFFFLKSVFYSSSLTAIGYKNCIMFYLWNSFFTSLVYGLGLVLIALNTGTLDFVEISFFDISNFSKGIFFLIMSVSWKLGLPGLHFFKVQLYLYLDEVSLFFFSITSTFINVIIFFFLLRQAPVIIFLNTYSLLIVSVLFVLIAILFSKVESFQVFLALSSVVTLFVCVVMLLF